MTSQETDKGFHVEEEGTDEQIFSCNFCVYKHKKEGIMKSHVTRQHIKKHKEKNNQVEDVHDVELLDEDIEEDMRLMAECNRPPVNPEDQADTENLADKIADPSAQDVQPPGRRGISARLSKKLKS